MTVLHSQQYFRRVATFLLVAALLQTVPDILVWGGQTKYSYRPGDNIAVLWFSVWMLKAAAARYAVHVLRHPTPAAIQVHASYQSGWVPTAFVMLASAVLMVQLTRVPQQSELPLVIFQRLRDGAGCRRQQPGYQPGGAPPSPLGASGIAVGAHGAGTPR